jgi:two-component sensor histidine kinase
MLGYVRVMRRWPLWARVAMAAGGLILVFLFQIPLETEVPGEPFLLFFLVVTAATIAFGEGTGLFGVAVSTLLALWFFEPSGPAVHQAADLIRIELYALLAGGAVMGLARLGTALLDADEAARASAQSERAQAVLLRELAHRVANNFAAVASLIRRRANLVDDGEAKSVLNEAVEQVMVLARVHGRLRPGHGDVTLDSKSFLQELCDDLKVLVARDQALAIECIAASYPLPVAQAIPLGLIANELVTNAIKHAFPEGRAGTIWVSLQENADRLSLSVHDDGIGLNDGRVRGTGMGRELARLLAQQLGGELEVKSTDRGSKFRVLFPWTGADARAASARPEVALPH